MNLLQILLDHFLEVLHDVDVVHRHSVEGFFHLVGVEDELALIGDVGVDEMDVLVGLPISSTQVTDSLKEGLSGQ